MAQLVPVEHDPFVKPPANPAEPPEWLKGGIRNAAHAMFVDPFMSAAKALSGRMTDAEAQDFAFGAAAGLIPMGRGLKAAKGIRAYHGSPHDFDRFDMSKIGTGEGAQAYGHGLYFADNPDVARTYQSKVSAMQGVGGQTIDGRPINWDNPADAAAFELMRHNGNREAAAEFYERTFKNSEVPKILRSGVALPEVKPPGRMYEVNINAHPDQFIDWDAPLSKQPKLEQTMRRIGADPTGPGFEGQLTGAEGYRALQNKYFLDQIAGRGTNVRPQEVDAIASQAVGKMAQEGIPGIKYLDQGSRTAGEGSRNYVVFDDKLIEILKKYGFAGLAVLPPAVAAGVQERLVPVDHDPFATAEKR